jgi:hypothetical protein
MTPSGELGFGALHHVQLAIPVGNRIEFLQPEG